MVQRGEYLERMTLIQSGALTLEGLYHRGTAAPPLLLAPPHPRYGGSMDSPVLAEIAWAVTRAGHATLRFNYRGVGASQGEWSGGDGEEADTEAAMDLLRQTATHPRVALCGYSFGAGLALRISARRKEVSHLVLIAPPAQMTNLGLLGKTRARITVVCGHQDLLLDLAALRAALEPLEDRASLEVIAGADHVFTRGLTDVGKAVVAALAR